MNLLVHLTPTEETRLFMAANQGGGAPEEWVRSLVCEHLPAVDPIEEMPRRIRDWQAQDRLSEPALAPAHPGLTPTPALFQQWEEEDAHRTDEEISTNDRLWLEYQRGIDDERKNAGMRPLY